MAEKQEVNHGAITQEQAETIMALFVEAKVASPIRRVFGGYSAANYDVELADGRHVLLKACNDQALSEAQEQAEAVHYLELHGFKTAYPLPLLSGRGYVTEFLGKTRPSLVYDFMPGMNADKLCRSAVKAASASAQPDNGGGKSTFSPMEKAVLTSVGDNMAKLHLVPPPRPGHIRHCMTSQGCCMVGKQHEANDEMHGSEHTMSQPYTAFHDTMLPVLDDAMATPGLPSGVLHGDPFLDNMLADPASGELTAIIDWEDIAVGPYVFDVAVCIAGCCFGPDNKIDKNRLKAFLMGYTGTRMLSADERRLLPTFCKLALLCNATWRFRNFQIHHREIDHARESYRELYDRMLDASVADAIETVMGEVASARGVVTAPNSVAMFGGGASSWWVAASLLGCLALGFFIGRRR